MINMKHVEIGYTPSDGREGQSWTRAVLLLLDKGIPGQLNPKQLRSSCDVY